MKIVITGAKGQLGSALKNKFSAGNELWPMDSKDLDITDEKQVDRKILKIRPDIIINGAAYTNVDAAEENYELAERVNVLGVKNLVTTAKKCKAIFVTISTDYVFDGKSRDAYLESDIPHPINKYGLTKLSGEQEALKYDKSYVLRIAWLYGDNKKYNNFINTMAQLVLSKDQISVVDDQYGSPTYTVDLVNAIEDILNNKIPFGLYNVVNKGCVSRFELVKKINSLLKSNCQLKPVSSNFFKTTAPRPNHTCLATHKIESQNIHLRSWESALTDYIKNEYSSS